jgi:hypothetical protein
MEEFNPNLQQQHESRLHFIPDSENASDKICKASVAN